MTPSASRQWDGLEDRFWARVDASGDCWGWTGTRNQARYGRWQVDGTWYSAHRIAWEMLVGPIPDGLVLDHLCRNTSCVNPDHLEVVTEAANILRGTGTPARNARKTRCKRGHPLDGKWSGNPRYRRCMECQRRVNRAWYAKRKAAA